MFDTLLPAWNNTVPWKSLDRTLPWLFVRLSSSLLLLRCCNKVQVGMLAMMMLLLLLPWWLLFVIKNSLVRVCLLSLHQSATLFCTLFIVSPSRNGVPPAMFSFMHNTVATTPLQFFSHVWILPRNPANKANSWCALNTRRKTHDLHNAYERIHSCVTFT